jgi:hypothetical protein
MNDTCAICGEPTVEADGSYIHTHGDQSCGTGDGATAFPKALWDVREAELRSCENPA